jgi:hypothetical protein
MARADQQPPNPDRHIAEQRAKRRGVMALAGQHPPTAGAPAAALARRGHLRRHDLGLERRREPLRLVKPETEVSQAGLLAALDPGDLQGSRMRTYRLGRSRAAKTGHRHRRFEDHALKN